MATMGFVATFSAHGGCAACRLRFPRGDACPSCGGRVLDLADRRALAAFRRAARRGPDAGAVSLVRLAQWAPRRPWIVAAVGLLLATPAAYELGWDRNGLLRLWMVTDASGFHTEYDGLSRGGFELLALGALGVVIVGFTLLTGYASARVARNGAGRPAVVVRVHGADAPLPEGHVRLSGIARLSTVETTAPLSGEACLVFGLHGRVGEMDVADADGGDFDVELDSGERVALSLEHAVLVADDGAATRLAVDARESEDVASFLEARGIALRDAEVRLDEARVHDGDRVTVEGRVLGGKLVAFRPGTASGRVVAGDAGAPLRVRIGAEPGA